RSRRRCRRPGGSASESSCARRPRAGACRVGPASRAAAGVVDVRSESGEELSMLEAVALPLIKYALSEDVGTGDITSLNTIRSGVRARAAIVAKEKGVIAGVDIAGLTFREADATLKYRRLLADGSCVEAGAACAQVVGDA